MLQDEEERQSVDDLDDNGMSALHYAARFNYINTVVLLVEEGKAGRCHFILYI